MTTPRVTKNALLLVGAAVAGPSLMVAGARYPGGMWSRAFLVTLGAGLTATTYYYFNTDVRGTRLLGNSALVRATS